MKEKGDPHNIFLCRSCMPYYELNRASNDFCPFCIRGAGRNDFDEHDWKEERAKQEAR
jgi:hypothetical protein